MNNILIYGGSFDPIHQGHLQTALAVQHHFQFERFIFLPCKTPVLKQPTQASAEQRITMLKLALQPYPAFSFDLREIERATPSFMVETLRSFRQEQGTHVALTLLLGIDAFLQLPHWHAWKTILHFCHLLVIQRAGVLEQTLSPPLLHLLHHHETLDPNTLLTLPAGKIYRFNAGEYAISSTEIRQNIHQGLRFIADVPEHVAEYIKQQRIYQLKP